MAVDSNNSPEHRSRPPGTSMVVDTHHHFYPPQYVARRREEILAISPGFQHVVDWTPEDSLAAMDEAGVDKAILSISTPGIWFDDTNEARVVARECNEYAAALVRDYPDRFDFFAAVPLPDSSGSIAEIAYAIDQLGAVGVGLLTNYGGRYLGDPVFSPVFEELDRRGTTVYIHPTTVDCCRNLVTDLPPAFLEFVFDTTRTAASLLFSGTLTRLRKLRFIFSHGGGTLPMLTGRLELLVRNKPALQKLFPQGLDHELARHYYDTVSIMSPAAVRAMKTFVPSTQMVFGTDCPYGPIDLQLKAIAAFDFSDADRALVIGANAQRLLKL
jgi:predicted TIM-barrel fold metal-dependent hydrolase